MLKAKTTKHALPGTIQTINIRLLYNIYVLNMNNNNEKLYTDLSWPPVTEPSLHSFKLAALSAMSFTS